MYKEVKRLSEEGVRKWNKQAKVAKAPGGEHLTLDEWARFLNYRSRACLALGEYKDVETGCLSIMAQMQNDKISFPQRWLAVILLRDCMLSQHRTAEAKNLERRFPDIFLHSASTKGIK